MSESRIRQFWTTKTKDFFQEFISSFENEHKQTRTKETLQHSVLLDQKAFQALLTVGKVIKQNPSLHFMNTPIREISEYLQSFVELPAAAELSYALPISCREAQTRRLSQRLAKNDAVKRTMIRLAALESKGVIHSFDPEKLPGSGKLANEPSLDLMFLPPGEGQGQKKAKRTTPTVIVRLTNKERKACQSFIHDWIIYQKFVMTQHQGKSLMALSQQLRDPVREAIKTVTLGNVTQNWMWMKSDLSLVRSGSVSFLYLGITEHSFLEGTAVAVNRELERVVPAQLTERGTRQAREMWQRVLNLPVADRATHGFLSWVVDRARDTVVTLNKLRLFSFRYIKDKKSIYRAVREHTPRWSEIERNLLRFYDDVLSPNVIRSKSQLDRIHLFDLLFRKDPDPFVDEEYLYGEDANAGGEASVPAYPLMAQKAIGTSQQCNNENLQFKTRCCMESVQRLTVTEVLDDFNVLANRLHWLLSLLGDKVTDETSLISELLSEAAERKGGRGDATLERREVVSQTNELLKCNIQWIWQQHERMAADIHKHAIPDGIIRAVRCRFDVRCDLMLRDVKRCKMDPFFATFSEKWENVLSHVETCLSSLSITTKESSSIEPCDIPWTGTTTSQTWKTEIQKKLDISCAEATKTLMIMDNQKWPMSIPVPLDLSILQRDGVPFSFILDVVVQSRVFAAELDLIVSEVRKRNNNKIASSSLAAE